MKLAARLVTLAALSISAIAPQSSLEAYGYQLDSQGYAYTDSAATVSNAPWAPVAAVGIAVVIGAILYASHHKSGGSHNKHHNQPHHNHCH